MDKQIIKITIDDLINGNLRDMEFTAQFSVYKQAVKSLAKQLKTKWQECESLRNLLVEQNDVMRTNELIMKEFGIEILKDITTGDITVRSIKLIELKQECEELRGVIRKDICSHYVLGECSQNHHNNCVGRNQCIKDLEQECEDLKKTIDDLLHKPEIQDKILWKIDNEALLGSKDAWIYKLSKTLTEIKEIGNYSFNLSTSELIAKLEQILQKCEVINE